MDSAIFTAIKSFFDTFGPAVFVPVVLYVIALCLKVTPKKAFMSALSAGVGLMGFMLIIGAFSPDNQPLCLVIGAMAHGAVNVDYTEGDISISQYPLSAAIACTKICSAFEDAWNIF